MPKKKSKRTAAAARATHTDADLILKLYELRREELMRKARNYVLFEFKPRSTEEFMSVATAFGTQEQTYCRMVFSYWEQAAAFVNRGALHEALFDDCCAEMYFLYAKFQPFITAMRESINPDFLAHVERIANRTVERRARVERLRKMIAEFRSRAARTATHESFKAARTG